MDDLSPSREENGAEERRAHRRRKLGARVDVVLDDGTGLVNLRTLDVSEGGLFVVAERLPEPGSRLRFGLRLGPGSAIVRGIGEVRWRRERDEEGRPPGAGILMVSLPDDSRQELMRGLRLVDSGELGVAARSAATDVAAERAAEAASEAPQTDGDPTAKTVPGAAPPPVGEREDRVPTAVGLLPRTAESQSTSDDPEKPESVSDRPEEELRVSKAGVEPSRSALPAGVTPARPVSWPKEGGGRDRQRRGSTHRWLGPVVAGTILLVAVVVLLVLPRVGQNIGIDERGTNGTAGRVIPEAVATEGTPATGDADQRAGISPGEALEAGGGTTGEPASEMAEPPVATEVAAARWRPSDTGTDVVVTLNGRLEPARVDDLRLASPPRYLVRVEGIVAAPGPADLRLDDAPLPVRVGYHPELRPPELHLVVDLAGADQATTSWSIEEGTRLVVTVTP